MTEDSGFVSAKDFTDKVNDCKNLMHKIARAYSFSREDQEDLIQDMIAQLWKSYPAFRADSTFKTWLYRVCLNTALTHHKKGRLRNHMVLKDILPDLHRNEEPEDFEKKEVMYFLIKKLSEIDRALILSYLEGFTGQEIAGNLGISEGSVRVRLLRIKQKLKEESIRYGFNI